MFINQLPKSTKNCQTSGTALKPINVLRATGEITKTGIFATTFQKPLGGANPYDQFRYAPLIIF